MLYDLDYKTGSLYTVNGIMMTLSFLIARVAFQTWIVVFKLWPHVFNNNPTDYPSKFYCFYAYLVLCALNFYWFSLMVRGLIKVLTAKPASKKLK
jgi:hypothetical protein